MSDPIPPTAPEPMAAPEGRRGLGRGLRLLLVLSLGLNLLILGVIGGAVLGEWRNHERPIVRDLGFGPYGEALSHADRIALMRDFARETGGFGVERKVAREVFGELLSVLRAEPLDRQALQHLMMRQERHMAERLALGQKLLVRRIEAMSPQERQAFANRLQEALARGPRGHRPPPGDAAPQDR